MSIPSNSQAAKKAPPDSSTQTGAPAVPPPRPSFLARLKRSTQLVVALVVTGAVTLSLLAIVASVSLLYYVQHEYRAKAQVIVASTPAGQVQTVTLSGGLWTRALVQTDLGFYGLRDGMSLPRNEPLTLELRANTARYLCDAQHHCVELL